MKVSVIFLFLFFQTCLPLMSQQADSSAFSMNVDMVSRYVWRGQLFSPSPNIQPYASLSLGSFTLGTWGSYGLSEHYAEVDLSIAWNYKRLGITLSDYCGLDEIGGNDYFNVKNDETPHSLEGSISYQLTDQFPLTLTAATFFYGADRDGVDNYYSTYLEVSYPLSASEHEFNFFVGGTLWEGLYGTKAGIVNAGFSASKELKVTENFAVPVSLRLAANPLSKNIYLVFSLTL